MKRPQPDIGDILRASFLNNVGSAKKLKRLWGTTAINGVEVLTYRQFYYPDSLKTAEFEKLFKFIGAYEQVTTGTYSGIESAWVYFNKNKGSDFVTSAINADDFIADNLNTMWGVVTNNGVGYTLTTAIVIEGVISDTRSEVDSTTSLLNPLWTSDALAQAIEANYDTLWDTCVISQQGIGTVHKGYTMDEVTKVNSSIDEILSPEDPWVSALARNALRSSGVPCTIKQVTLGISANENKNIHHTYVVTLEIPYIVLSPLSGLVQAVTTDVTRTYTSKTRAKISYQNGYYTKQEITAADSSDLDPIGAFAPRNYLLWENEANEVNALYSALWYNFEGVYYLRADPFVNPRAYGLSFKELYSYVVTLIDTGYKKKKAKWWQKLLAVVVFVVSFVLAPVTGGTSLTLTQIASSLIYASIVLTVFSLAFSALGMQQMASAFSEVNKFLEPLVVIASVFLAINNIVAMANKLGDKGIEKVINEAIKDFADDIVKGITDITSGQFSQAALSLMDKTVKLLTMPAQLRLDDINSRNKDLKAEYDELAKEASRESDLLMAFMYINPKPATADWSMYAATFDQPYERGGGTLSLGNIQRTTKQALRKGTYTDSAFDNILFV